MPTKSNNMSPMPMQPKIGEASLKFGPDWLRALSSSETGGNNPGGGDRGEPSSGGRYRGDHGGSFGGWGTEGSGGGSNRSPFSNSKDYNSYPFPHNSSPNSSSLGSSSSSKRAFKQSEHRYSREELLALYDKNLEAPGFLLSFGTLYIEKMQPPLAFSQPSEDEIRIWHIPQPESSRQGPGSTPVGRGYSIRGRGGAGVDRGRGRGRGYYPAGSGRPHEDEERLNSGFGPRPRTFERSQSNHERGSWGERSLNGGPPPGGLLATEVGEGRGGSWRSREYSGGGGGSGKRYEENEDGWRKPNQRWRRGDEEDDYNNRSSNSNSRRLHRSWSEDEAQDNLPEWARDNPSEESGTFDASGAFHGEERGKSREREESGGSIKRDRERERAESEPSSGSHSDRVQKRVIDGKPAIPASVLEEAKESQSHLQHPPQHPQHQHSHNSINIKQPPPEQTNEHSKQSLESMSMEYERHGLKENQQLNLHQNQQQRRPHRNSHNEEDHYRSMTEEAMNLVSKLIEEDGTGARRLHGQGQQHGHRQQNQMPAAVVAEMTNNLNELSRAIPQGPTVAATPQGPSQGPAAPSVPSSADVWFYRDPQGSVQGPFSTHEMALWCSQGYFSVSLLLRRECDKIFISLLEMGKLYGRNPFLPAPDAPTPPPIQDPSSSALEFARVGDAGNLSAAQQAQLQHQQRLQLQQQNLLRDQYMINMGHRKEELGWQGNPTGAQGQMAPQVQVQGSRSAPNAGAGGHGTQLSAEQIQAQLIMSMAKSQDPATIDQLQVLFQRQQLKSSTSNDVNPKNSFPDLMQPRQLPPTMEGKSPIGDPIQSLVQQLTSMTNTQHKATTKPNDVINAWGQGQGQGPPVVQTQWNHNPQHGWEYREQIAKMQAEEDLRRRAEEEEGERKRLEEEERKRLEDVATRERERKRLEELQRMEEEKQRKIREEQYLVQKQHQEALRKQAEEAEIQRAKELQRQALEQQRQLRDEQTRLAEEAQLLEQQRVDKERKEKETQEKLRLERERQAAEQLKIQQQQQFSWNSSQQQQMQATPHIPPSAPQIVNKSLLEIQQEEAAKQAKEEKKKAVVAAEQRAAAAAAAQAQKAINLKWAGTAGPGASAKQTPIKSLTEIQAEEQAKLQKQQEAEREKRAIVSHHQAQQAAWSAQLTWANRASALAASGGAPSGGSKKVNGGSWEEGSISSKLSKSSPGSGGHKTSKKGKDGLPDDAFMKLFNIPQGEGQNVHGSEGGSKKKTGQSSNPSAPADEFTRWCGDRICAIASGSVDIPTFVSFLKEVESPYEVGDYVRSYLGDAKEAKEFAREFLERRSRWKAARQGGGSGAEDNLCRPASAVNPNSDFQEVKGKGKKTKKGRMQKVDSRILGFSTSAAADRLNRDYGDSTD